MNSAAFYILLQALNLFSSNSSEEFTIETSTIGDKVIVNCAKGYIRCGKVYLKYSNKAFFVFLYFFFIP
jgi:hypothetical protein